MKKILTLILTLAMVLSLAACTKTEAVYPTQEPESSPAAESQAPETAAPETEAPQESQEPEAEPEGEAEDEPEAEPEAEPEVEPETEPEVEVEDQPQATQDIPVYTSYGDKVYQAEYCQEDENISLPFFNLPSEDAVEVNDDIKKLYDSLKKSGGSASYWLTGEDELISVLVMADSVHTYNFDPDTGALLDAQQAVAAAGFSVDKVKAAYEDQCRAYFRMGESYYNTEMTAETMIDEAVSMINTGFDRNTVGVYWDGTMNLVLVPYRRSLTTGNAMEQYVFTYNPDLLTRALFDAPEEAVFLVVNDADDQYLEEAVAVAKAGGSENIIIAAVKEGTTVTVTGGKMKNGQFKADSRYSDQVELSPGEYMVVQADRTEEPTVMVTVTCDGVTVEYPVSTSERWGECTIETVAER